jgi:hypothetical protein
MLFFLVCDIDGKLRETERKLIYCNININEHHQQQRIATTITIMRKLAKAVNSSKLYLKSSGFEFQERDRFP